MICDSRIAMLLRLLLAAGGRSSANISAVAVNDFAAVAGGTR